MQPIYEKKIEVYDTVYEVLVNKDTSSSSILKITEFHLKPSSRTDRLAFVSSTGSEISIPDIRIDKVQKYQVVIYRPYYFSTLERAETFISDNWANYLEAQVWKMRNLEKVATAYTGDFKEFINSYEFDFEDFLLDSKELQESFEDEDIVEDNPKFIQISFGFLNGSVRLDLKDCFLGKLETGDNYNYPSNFRFGENDSVFQLHGTCYHEHDVSMGDPITKFVDSKLYTVRRIDPMSFLAEKYIPIELISNGDFLLKSIIETMLCSFEIFNKVYSANLNTLNILSSDFSIGHLSYSFFD